MKQEYKNLIKLFIFVSLIIAGLIWTEHAHKRFEQREIILRTELDDIVRELNPPKMVGSYFSKSHMDLWGSRTIVKVIKRGDKFYAYGLSRGADSILNTNDDIKGNEFPVK